MHDLVLHDLVSHVRSFITEIKLPTVSAMVNPPR
jgi:hypothetical protein